MTHAIDGMWQNSYGSQMRLSVQKDGLLLGDYSSTTGSSGRYLMIGYVSGHEPNPSLGQGVVLSIYWRSVERSAPDASWHWVSTYCGQLQANQQMEVINSLVASTQFEQIIVGDYIDKLGFHKVESNVNLQPFELSIKGEHPDLMNGTWSDPSNSLSIQLAVTNPELGIVSGSASFQQQCFPIYGFTDTHRADLDLQSLSISGLIPNDKQPISISGTLDVVSQQLNVSAWLGNGTAPEESYLQASMSAWVLNKSSK
ncbi:avidin/streptavidin family protein [Agarivorans sp. QJM3NY_29]|uniref:avidin/streptavidin family protein n=1 Tax=unclassified Agarivorans TaxID=2636026 RepID=UPI003D7C5624